MRVTKLIDSLSVAPLSTDVFILVGGERRYFTVVKVLEGLYLVPKMDEKVPLPPDLVENRSEQSKFA